MIKIKINKGIIGFTCLGLLLFAGAAAAASLTVGSYLAGLGFSVGAIMKFKAHKDNPTQIPIGTPVALVFISAALLFLPTILGIAGATMFSTGGGKTAGPEGSVFTNG